MVYINGVWEDIRNSDDLKRVIAENISYEAAERVDILDIEYKNKYETLEYEYDSLQDDYDLLENEYDDLESRVDMLENDNKELQNKIQTIIFILRSDKSDSECCEEIAKLCGIEIDD